MHGHERDCENFNWSPAMTKLYRLLGVDGKTVKSIEPGKLGGYRPLKIYGRLDCWSARRFLAKGGYAIHRVFFLNESSTIAAGYRPCGHCLRERYSVWKRGGEPGTQAYPWLFTPSGHTKST
jgi:hypothetical protein